MSEIKVDTVAEKTSANGVTIDGLNIKDSKLVTANSVVTANITDGAVSAAKLASGVVQNQSAFNLSAVTEVAANLSVVIFASVTFEVTTELEVTSLLSLIFNPSTVTPLAEVFSATVSTFISLII